MNPNGTVGNWPEARARVEVFGPWFDRWLLSRVEQVHGANVRIEAPRIPGTLQPVVATPGDAIMVSWVSDKGATELECQLALASRNTTTSWLLHAQGEPVVRQRRNYVRAAVNMAATVAPHPGDPPLEGWVIDLSEGGIRLMTDGRALYSGNRALLMLDIEGQEVFVQGEVLRVLPDRAGSDIVVFKFVDLHHRDADRIRRFVFGAQLRSPAR
ncbi:MAG: type pilus assembly PilZ [Actinomycetia bacterium]|nr:type pilus assembly PilZ [Actinomycetes bacterium]